MYSQQFVVDKEYMHLQLVISKLYNHLNIYKLQNADLIRKYIQYALLNVCFTQSIYTLKSFKNVYNDLKNLNFFNILITVMENCSINK